MGHGNTSCDPHLHQSHQATNAPLPHAKRLPQGGYVLTRFRLPLWAITFSRRTRFADLPGSEMVVRGVRGTWGTVELMLDNPPAGGARGLPVNRGCFLLSGNMINFPRVCPSAAYRKPHGPHSTCSVCR